MSVRAGALWLGLFAVGDPGSNLLTCTLSGIPQTSARLESDPSRVEFWVDRRAAEPALAALSERHFEFGESEPALAVEAPAWLQSRVERQEPVTLADGRVAHGFRVVVTCPPGERMSERSGRIGMHVPGADVEPLWLPVRVRERVDFEVHPAAILLNPLRAAPVEVHLKRASTSDARLVSVESRHERLGASIVPGEGPSECSLVVSFLGPPAPQPRELTSLVLRVEGGAHAEQVIPVAIVSAP